MTVDLLALVTIIDVLIAAALTIALHILQPEFDPMTRAMSDYVHSRHGVLMTATLIVFGLSLLALAGAFRYVAASTQQQLGVMLLAGAGGCLLIAGIFPIDNTPDGSFNTVAGAIHAIASFIFSPVLVTAMLCLLGVLNQVGVDPKLQFLTWVSAILTAVAFVVLLFVNLIARLPYGGLLQRIFVSLVCFWSLLSALGLLMVPQPTQV